MKWSAAIVCAAGIAFAGAASADVVAPGDVMVNDDFEVTESITGAAGDPAMGRKWFADRKLGNCLACHANSDLADQPFHGEVGPDARRRRRSRWTLRRMLRGIVANSPRSTFEDSTMMPAFYKTGEFISAGRGLYRQGHRDARSNRCSPRSRSKTSWRILMSAEGVRRRPRTAAATLSKIRSMQ